MSVRRFVLAIVVGLLAVSASGVFSVVVNEPCTTAERPGQDDACPPTCVTCGCCAQAVEPVSLAAATPDIPIAPVPDVLPSLPLTSSRDILHVPKLLVA